ncbi:MAG: serine--tRNA ligase [Candidatus Andersenbacteria bacterium]
MIDLDLLRQHPGKFEAESKRRGLKDVDIKKTLKLDAVRRTAIQALEEARAEHRTQSEEIAKVPSVKRKAAILKATALAAKVKKLEPAVEKAEASFREVAALLPNLAHESVPAGKNSVDNKVEAVVGEKPVFDFTPKPHWQLAEKLGLLDSKRGTRLSGARFNYLKGDLVRLELALLQFALDEVLQKGFTPVLHPLLVKEEAMYGAGMFPLDRSEVYALKDDALYLSGTSEIPLLNYHAHEVIDVAAEPIRLTGFATNFRREAGAYGKDMHGMIRTHQFDKLELFMFVSQEQSWDMFNNELLPIAEGILKKLGLHYRRLVLCSADLPRKFQKTFDLEVWLPSENRYLETNSISHAGDYQARRLGIKYKTKDGQRRYVHTLNATACAFSRIPVAILENYQQADGRVAIPEVLQPYLGNQDYLGQAR